MHSGVVVDFSEKEEAFKPFLKLNLPLYEAGVSVPKVFTYNREEFFVFMEDLGSTHLCDISSSDFELFYDKAIDAIVKMQNTETEELEPYDEILLKEDIKLRLLKLRPNLSLIFFFIFLSQKISIEKPLSLKTFKMERICSSPPPKTSR